MLIDSSSKESFTTVTEETRIPCSCGFDRVMVRQKLEEIMSSLYEEIAAKQKQIQKAHRDSMESIRQKQEIIERLVIANSKLVLENQTLCRKLIRAQKNSKQTINEVQSKYKTIIKEMTIQVNYLQQRNEFLKNEILSTLQFIPQELLLPYQINSNCPRSRCSNQNLHPSRGETRETRYSHITYKSPPAKRLSTDVSPPHYATYWVGNKSRKRNSNRTESRVEEAQHGVLLQKRSKSTVGRQEFSVTTN